MDNIANFCKICFQREWHIYMRNKGSWVAPVIFFLLIASIFPIALGSMQDNLQTLGVCIIWISAILALILAQENLFKTDYNLGVFEQFSNQRYALLLLILNKVSVNWLVTVLPLIIVCPFMAISFGLSLNSIFAIEVTLLLATPSLCLILALGSALTVSLPRGGILLAIITLPLLMPILILGASAGIFSLQALNYSGQLAFLAAIMLSMIMSVPWVISNTIRVNLT